MTIEKALARIHRDMNISTACDDYIVRTMKNLGCGEDIDIPTIKAIEQVIRNELR